MTKAPDPDEPVKLTFYLSPQAYEALWAVAGHLGEDRQDALDAAVLMYHDLHRLPVGGSRAWTDRRGIEYEVSRTR